ncbi:hypothetical protein F0U62_00330 [Cystobacter fuscus]|uniref:adventurous gliding motility protein AgmC n=1 Tax=Cystobacter fuscus TaxID=43 RepID=UPI002B2EF135|nr:hypothetical protein F0U62_00330 [Cystobacter fuscus]
MKTSFMKKFSRTALVAAMACALPALAGADNVGLGNGQDGRLSDDTNYISGNPINVYARVTESRKTGESDIAVDDTKGLKTGHLVLVLQTTNSTPGRPEDPKPLVGRWEFARIAEVSNKTLKLTEPLQYGYTGKAAQVIRVPEYTEATVSSSRSLSPMKWNGSKGGVLAFLVQNTLTIQPLATINATGMGFRGGTVTPTTGMDPCPNKGMPVADLEKNSPKAQKGEGISGKELQTGRAQDINAGGGGLCGKGGGGGGGNANEGGNGGNGSSGQTVGGQGGAKLEFSPDGPKQFVDRLLMGGGGGAGYTTSTEARAGGAGGGIIFIRAGELNNSGLIEANGQPGDVIAKTGASTPTDSHSGGGAGGSLYLLIAQSATCTVAYTAQNEAFNEVPFKLRGGTGGNASGTSAAGGGGAGGRLLFQMGSGDCTVDEFATLGGTAGKQDQAMNTPGARAADGQPGSYTDLTTRFGRPVLLPPVVTVPINKASFKETTPKYGGTSTYAPGTWVDVYVDKKPEPVGTVEVDQDGNWSIHPTRSEDVLKPGAHTVYAVAHNDGQGLETPPSEKTTFTVTEEQGPTLPPLPPPPSHVVTRDLVGGGVGCAASGGAPSVLAMMGLALLSTLRARRRQR